MNSKTTIYYNPSCSKSRATLELLTEKDERLDIVNYLDTPPDYETLKTLLDLLKIEPRELMRKGESLYQSLNLDDISLSEDDLIKAMLENPILIERPIVVKKGRAIIARPPMSVIDIL